MIRAEHRRWARIIFNPYITRLLRKNFSHFYLVNEPSRVRESNGLLLTPNHFSWWDGFFIDYVMRFYTNKKIHILMLEEQLKRYWFFRKLGAYSIDLNNPKKVIESLHYTQQIVNNPKNFVVYYPQGEIRPYDERPLCMKPGLKKVLHGVTQQVMVMPAAFKIQYRNEPKPDVFARFAPSLQGEQVADNFEMFIHACTKNLDELEEASRKKEHITDLFH
jgi:1-acyl-sn-glycerol-3-phosphate acyltransferase